MTQRPCDLNMSWSWALVIIQLLEDFPWPQKSVGVQLLDISFFISKLEKKSLLPPPPSPRCFVHANFLLKTDRIPQSRPTTRSRIIRFGVFFLLKWCTTWLIWKISVSILCNSALSFCKGKWRRINEHQF